MEQTIAWSFDLLTERERVVWERLAPFSGGFTVEAARAVCACCVVPEGGVFATLRSLEDKSLIVRARADRSRLRLLESLRAFARARMVTDSHASSALEAHRRYFLDFVLDAETQVRGQDQISWLRRVDDDHENIRAAIASGLQDGDGEPALRIAASLWRYWRVRGYWEDGGAILANLLAEFEAPSLARARALCAAGNLAHWQQEYEQANRLLAEATCCGEMVGDTEWSVPFSLLIRGINMIVGEVGELDEADNLLKESARYWRGNIGLNETDHTGLHLALYWRADCARRLGNTKRAQSLERQCRRTLEGHDDDWAKARYSFNLAVRAQKDGESRLAEEGFERSLTFWRELGDSDGIAESLIKLAWINFEKGAYEEAIGRLREALPLWRGLRAMNAVSDCLELAARLASLQSRHVHAAMLEGAVVRFREPMDRRQLKREWEQHLHASLRPSIEALGKVYFSENQKGRGLNIDSAVHVALEAVTND
jgi:tetratricopeptide (TPR) repeat protein